MERSELERALSEARPEALERALVERALAATGASNGALFLWDKKARALVLTHHVVEGLTVTLPDLARVDRPGIARVAFERDAPYLCRDSASDPHYTRYLLDVRSIAAAPIRWQGKPIGVITAATRLPDQLDKDTLRVLGEVAVAAAPFVRRVQADRQSREETGRPFLIGGLSPEWREVERRIELASPTDAPILVRGESGTGKDLVSRAIHGASRRADKPYVTVNCAAIPETLLESILFGHVRGAFTGATADKIGEFHKADGGTLFLDEVGELPVALQAKVLRAVEQGEVQPLGSNAAAVRVDVRLICATNRDLEAMVRDGRFRDDLYYRLGVMMLELPPLRRYKEQLEVMASVFIEQAAGRHGRPAPRIAAATMARLAAYDYPGNVRELRNAIEHAVILCSGPELQPEELPRPFQAAGATRHRDDAYPAVAPALGAPSAAAARRSSRPAARPSLRALREQWLAPLERQYLVELLAEHRGNVKAAAQAAGVDAVTMYRLLRRRGIALVRTAE